jgi:murein DD-endopeptidase MepM/ murein hydrolase activator NlpD
MRQSNRALKRLGAEIRMIPNLPLSTLRISTVDMMRLRVRTRGTGNAVLPDFLYQGMPTSAMALMATIPRGAFAVSIPHQNGLGDGYRILKSPPPADGFVIVYARQANGRYEATGVRFGSETFEIAEFGKIARQWVEEHEGGPIAIPGRYAYFAPTVDLWGAVMRDNGYIAADFIKLPSDRIPELGGVHDGIPGAGIIARTPVQAGTKQPPGAALPVFTRVELTLDARPGPQSIWISFMDYQKTRILRSRPPASVIPQFVEWMALLTAECGFTHWLFRRGMFFGARNEWWGDRVRRRTEHEGLDFVEGNKPGTGIRNIPEGAPARAIADGEVVAVLKDFLGKTVVMRHSAISDETGSVFYTLLSHIRPAAKLKASVVRGQLIGEVAESRNADVPAHLHLSGAWIPQTIRPSEISLNHINPAFTPVVLINFNELVQGSPLVRQGSAPDLPMR